jgi:hypothetical protein
MVKRCVVSLGIGKRYGLGLDRLAATLSASWECWAIKEESHAV